MYYDINFLSFSYFSSVYSYGKMSYFFKNSIDFILLIFANLVAFSREIVFSLNRIIASAVINLSLISTL